MTPISTTSEFSREEVGLALRNPGMHLEGLRYEITPVGMHYLLIHFDIPHVDSASYKLPITGRLQKPLNLTLKDVKARPKVSMPVMMECGGNGRAHLSPRPISAPWHDEAVGCAEWTGTPLRPILEEADLLDDAVEILFSGYDRGLDQGVEHSYERSLNIEDALSDEVILAYEMNGSPLPPQHGAPLRLIVPDWYGMASVKWLKGIQAVDKPFEGIQQTVAYNYRQSEDDPGTPVTRKHPHALMIPPGIPDFLSRKRHVQAGNITVQGRAWSGFGPIERVEFSPDSGETWHAADLGETPGPYAWTSWSSEWDARPGEYELCVRATDASGKTQPLSSDESWNQGGYGVNVVQRVPVVVD
ncbi:MAG: sulfite oxidase [Actinomycetota bacterium]|nr:sulfite oxidase [Actinomycetota bacterium]